MSNFFSKIGLLFSNFAQIESYIVKLYEILKRLKPVIQLVDTLTPDQTKLQNKLDTATPALYNAIDKGISIIESVSVFLKITLPSVQSVGASVDAIKELNKSAQ